MVNSPDFLIDVTTQSDGCGDGRSVSRVFENEVVVNVDNTRKKVFGGGAAMMAAGLIGSGSANGKTVDETFSHGMSLMRARGMDFGAHTDNHAEGANSGCGAIDKAPVAIANITKFQDQIRDNMLLLGQDPEITDVVLKNFAEYATEIADQTDYQGAKVMDEIMKSGKMVKELADAHLEARVYLNFVPGKTVNQELIRRVTNDKAQAFSVDVWRMVEIAQGAFPNDEITQKVAVASQVAYTLGVAATLTQGDIPVVLVNSAEVGQPAPVAV